VELADGLFDVVHWASFRSFVRIEIQPHEVKCVTGFATPNATDHIKTQAYSGGYVFQRDWYVQARLPAMTNEPAFG